MACTITYVRGDATKPVGDGPKLIVHVVNDVPGWGAGFVLAVSRRWTKPELSYRGWARHGPNFKLGVVQPVRVSPDVWVVNMLAQHGYWNGDPTTPAIDYDALRLCLVKVAKFAAEHKASVHAPKFGAGLAGGVWQVIEKIIERELVSRGVDVTIYEYEPSRG